MNLLIAFITGLTTGGLGCMAIQGGLLATMLAQQYEIDSTNKIARHQFIKPLFFFLSSRLAAYTVLGFLLGVFGSLFRFSPKVNAFLMIVIGLFMVGNGLRMLNIHPLFRYFVFKVPSCFNRYVSGKSKMSSSGFAPIMLGALTVLLPCGIAQAMMAAAIATGNPAEGAALMFAYTLGTVPAFIVVAFFITRLGEFVEKQLSRIAGIILIFFGLVPVDYGLNLAGLPLSFSKAFEWIVGPGNSDESQSQTGTSKDENTYYVTIMDNGYAPKILHLVPNKEIKLVWVTNNVKSCSLSVVIQELNYENTFPSTGQVLLIIPPQKTGTVIEYSCSMGMYHGKLVFDKK
jgi:sulfite exporter TauE/SafE